MIGDRWQVTCNPWYSLLLSDFIGICTTFRTQNFVFSLLRIFKIGVKSTCLKKMPTEEYNLLSTTRWIWSQQPHYLESKYWSIYVTTYLLNYLFPSILTEKTRASALVLCGWDNKWICMRFGNITSVREAGQDQLHLAGKDRILALQGPKN